MTWRGIKPEDFKGHPVLQAVLETLQLASKGRLVAEFDRVMGRLTAVKKDPRIKGAIHRYELAGGRSRGLVLAGILCRLVRRAVMLMGGSWWF